MYFWGKWEQLVVNKAAYITILKPIRQDSSVKKAIIYKVAALIFVLVFPVPGFSQIEGIILDASNQTPLPAATIVLNDSTLITSDHNGKFVIHQKIFPIDLSVSYIGYESISLSISEKAEKITIELPASNYMLGEVIVTAYEGRPRIMESPGSIALIPRKEMKVDNDIYFIPSLNRVTGIYAHSGAYNTNRITIRGIGSRSLFVTSKIRAYYDNIPLTTGDGETTVEDIDPNLIDRMETIKGPSSSLYGAGLGGTLLINSHKPSVQDRYLKYSLTAGSYGYLKNDLSFAYGNDKSRLGGLVNNIGSDGYRENNNYKRFTTGINYKSYLTEKSTISFLGTYIKLKAQIPSSIDSITYINNPRAAASNWAETEGFEDNNKFLTGFGINHKFNATSSMDGSIFYTFRKSFERRPFNILEDKVNAVGSRVKYNYFNTWNHYMFNFIIGGEYFIDFYNWQTYENDDKEKGGLISDNKELRENINVFFKADLTFPFGTYITIGLNYNHTYFDYENLFSSDGSDNSGDYSFGATFSPRVAISHPITTDLFIYGNISNGFSPPSLQETLNPDGTINPDIKPETGTNYEIGTKGMLFRKRLFFDVAFFSMHIKDLIVAERIGEDEFVGINAGKTINNGLEINLNYRLLSSYDGKKELTTFVTYTLADYVFKDFKEAGNDYSGNRLTGVPAHVLNTGITCNTRSGIYGNLNYQFVDEMPMRDDNSVYSDAYQLVNLKAGYIHSFNDHFEFHVYGILNNVFNEKYASMISVNAASFGGRLPRYYYPGLPRNFFLGIEVSYKF
jgi:iron complex outermembrane receptor protein